MRTIAFKKNVLAVAALGFLAAGCSSPFGSALPAGVLKSVNGGADWQFANNLKTGSQVASLAGSNMAKLAFDPNSSQTVYAGSASDGLYKSTDGAASWQNILSKILVSDFAVNQQNGQIIYVAGFFAGHGRVLKTTDGGASWNQIYNEATANNAVRSVALNPADQNQLVIGTNSGSVVKSSDGGLSWQLLYNFNDRVSRVAWQGGKIYVLLKTKGLYVAADSSSSFGLLTGQLTTRTGMLNYSTLVASFNDFYVDWASGNLIYLTTDKGVYKSQDSGQTWNQLSLPVQPGKLPAQAIDVSRSSSNIVFASVGSTIYKSQDAGNSWQTQGVTTAGNINYILIDPALPQVVYAGIYAVKQ